MNAVLRDFGRFYNECKSQDFAFYMAALYLIFSYLRPQAIYPTLDFLPWTQLSIVSGIIYLQLQGRLRVQSIHIITFVFFLVIVASSYYSHDPEFSFSRLHVPYTWLIEMFFFTSCIKNSQQFRLLTILFFLILFKMSFFGAKTWVMRGFGFTGWGIAGPPGFFANSGEYSLLMAMLAIMSLGFILGHKNFNKLYYVLPLTAVMTVLGASSRGGQMALIAGLIIVAFAIGKIRFKSIVLVLFSGYMIFLIMPDEQKERFTDMGGDNTSISRLMYWEKGVEMMNENPFFGVGYYTFAQYFSDNYSYLKDDDSYLGKRNEVAHNSFVEVGSTLGYSGLACYVGMILICYFQNRAVRKRMKSIEYGPSEQWIYHYSIGLDATMVVYVVGSFFMSVAFYPYIYLLMMFSQSNLNGVKELEASPD